MVDWKAELKSIFFQIVVLGIFMLLLLAFLYIEAMFNGG